MMKFALIQSDIIPDDIDTNLQHYANLLQQLKSSPDVIVFPEMFNCGFSSSLPLNAEEPEGKSTRFLQSIAHQYQCNVVAGLPILSNGNIYNRLLWVNSHGISDYYDKKHLFFGDDKQFCTAGTEKVIMQMKGIRFLPLICYDIRFPLWCRNQYVDGHFLYDCIILIANFPTPQVEVLKLLAQARAIENQAYVIVCNRIGKDGNDNPHNGNSLFINPLGKIIANAKREEEEILECDIDMELLTRLRKRFPVYEDWD